MRIFKSETKGLIGDDDEKQGMSQDARAEAARLRAEAARLEAQAGPQQLNAPVDDAVKEGVPVRQTEHGK
jgi:hypothetical protein